VIKNEARLQNLIPPDLPAIQADPNQLWRVYENLMINALKHNPPGLTLTLAAEVMAVTPRSQPNGSVQMIRCVVQDDGEGIPPDQCAMMFELYKRGQTARRTVGLGLGLYLCRQIITAHGGEIGVDSTLGAGSQFWFTLPLSR
jgi:two-component system sensor histidine kinase/response regulator